MRAGACAVNSRPDQRHIMVTELAVLFRRPPREHAGKCRARPRYVLREEPHDALRRADTSRGDYCDGQLVVF